MDHFDFNVYGKLVRQDDDRHAYTQIYTYIRQERDD